MLPRARAPLFALLLASSVVLIPVAACYEEPTIPFPAALPEGTLNTYEASVEAGTDGEAPPDAEPPDGATIVDASVDATVDAGPCAPVLPDEETGTFVSTTGTDGAACGTKAAPCKTIASGQTRAVATTKANVFVASGTYVERVVLAKGITVIGGWDTSKNWERACGDARTATVIQAPDTETITIDARSLAGSAGVSTLRVVSKAANKVAAGESLYGIFVSGTTANLTVKDVIVDVAAGGAGTSGTAGAAGVAPTGTCAASTGAAGTPGAAGTGAAAGTFGASGFVGGAGSTAGAPGTAGLNGSSGGPGTCVTCGGCIAVGCAFLAGATEQCGTTGKSGCGGAFGAGGTAGTSGGASIAVYAWNAQVTVSGSALSSGNGGDGGAGGAGGAGSGGSLGAAGAPGAECTTACVEQAAMCTEVKGKGNAGAAGSKGGVGGAGGSGGGGAGGSSYAIFQGGTALVTATGTTLAHGTAGKGGSNGGAAGLAGDRSP